ncbi:nucleolar complex-associated protein 3 [Calocera cornea HHB12733]|uniref:Nucleolar complex-associated protein 3 n=1 Tax=Calocera cornea HHB12733 TaxID=1353952 RepID=A0A165JGX7_9BASI|nr:nucleolar complex-associated protein 3 [Calocera cornea HHB12733]
MAPKSKQKPVKGKAQQNGASKKKQHAYDRPTIAVPRAAADESDPDLSEQELDILTSGNTGFLTNLDQKGISKSKKEIERLHKLSKPARPRIEDDLPDIEEHTDDESPWEEVEGEELSGSEDDDDDLDTDDLSVDEEEDDEEASAPSDSDAEKSYEINGRKRRREWEEDDAPKPIGRLPIKLANGQVKRLKDLDGRPVPVPVQEEESSSEEESEEEAQEEERTNNVATGNRFGRPAPAVVLSLPTRAERVQRAKEQIAGICQDVMADPENSLGLLRRLQTFTLSQLPSPEPGKPSVANDPLVRKLALLSLLSVFKDIVPSYRIRALTEKEQAEKVSQMVARTREWEQGLVGVYKAYLAELEREVKGKSELADAALRCLCVLLTDLTHFNFRTNVMSVVVARISRKSWDANSELCRESIVRVFKDDATGQASLDLVRLLNRMIKERKFRVHPNVLSALLSLRLKTELGRPAEKDYGRRGRKDGGKGREKEKEKKVHLSKKQKMARKETREIEKEMAEAEAAVDVEERTKTHTETLKLLFVLYFSILKSPLSRRLPLLPEALAGVSSFAHLINIDFFRDLLETLKTIIREVDGDSEEGQEDGEGQGQQSQQGGENEVVRACRTKLLCVVTAFQLLTGQGEALNIDLTEFINHLYALLLPLSHVLPLEEPLLPAAAPTPHGPKPPQPLSSLLFRALHLLFLPRHLTAGTARAHPAARLLAFSKRLLTCALYFPPSSSIRALEFVKELMAREPRLDGLMERGEEGGDGVWRGDVDDPALANGGAGRAWEASWLAASGEGGVRVAAVGLLEWRRL